MHVTGGGTPISDLSVSPKGWSCNFWNPQESNFLTNISDMLRRITNVDWAGQC
jgi:hypothetical protein